MNNWFSPTNPNSIPNQIANMPDIESSGPNSQELVAILPPLLFIGFLVLFAGIMILEGVRTSKEK